MIDRTCKTIVLTSGLVLMMGGLAPASAVKLIRDARMTGGLIAQVGSGSLELKELGDRFHVRLLLPDAAAAEKCRRPSTRCGCRGGSLSPRGTRKNAPSPIPGFWTTRCFIGRSAGTT